MHAFCSSAPSFHPTSVLQLKIDKTISILTAATAANGLPKIKLLVIFFSVISAKEDNANKNH